MWGLATEDTLRLLRAWKAEITPGSSKPTSTGRVVSKPTEPTPTRPPGWSQGRIAITNQAPQAADGWGARSASDPVRRSREVSCAHGPHIGMLFFDRDLDPVCEVHPQKRTDGYVARQTARQYPVRRTLRLLDMSIRDRYLDIGTAFG
ncbi:hypothetical protein DHEL01_v204550 [Diaporthe helianthi]|uniref:Uncharacterized protein n=1 Tax=Diaporthe helianthi TaxID=158607 RepID=A0A2P5I3K6_DIAHE|nr:hypothetical protein DHEL01_v204550 [Diaporthe helianthi]